MDFAIQNMITILSNKVLKRQSVSSDRDYSGGGWYDEVSYALYLYSDMSFKFVIDTFRSVSGGGLSLPYQNKEQNIGSWEIVYENFTTYLVLTFEDYSRQKFETKNLGNSLHKIGDETWNRYLMA